jgi:zinc/manganese transport system substrate-binding protein
VHRLALVILIALGLAGTPGAQAEPLNVVAAENFYGDVVEQLGGAHVKVTSVLTNPDQDPHLFEASASTARHVAKARIVILNGANYDPWMTRLLSASPLPGREVIDVAGLVGRKVGDNPHLWYDPAAIPALARAVSAVLVRLDPGNRAEYESRLAKFIASLMPLDDKIAELRKKYAGTPVTATEPVFNYMTSAIGLVMHNRGFQLAVMNDVGPSASQVAAFERDLKTRAVKVLLYNTQTTGKLTERMLELARASKVPVVGVTETMPPGMHFQDWMHSVLQALEAALAGKSP